MKSLSWSLIYHDWGIYKGTYRQTSDTSTKRQSCEHTWLFWEQGHMQSRLAFNFPMLLMMILSFCSFSLYVPKCWGYKFIPPDLGTETRVMCLSLKHSINSVISLGLYCHAFFLTYQAQWVKAIVANSEFNLRNLQCGGENRLLSLSPGLHTGAVAHMYPPSHMHKM